MTEIYLILLTSEDTISIFTFRSRLTFPPFI